MRRRKPVLLVDYSSHASQEAIEFLKARNIEFVEYDIAKFETSCCGDLPTTITPSVFAPEGIFKGLKEVVRFASIERKEDWHDSESAYW